MNKIKPSRILCRTFCAAALLVAFSLLTGCSLPHGYKGDKSPMPLAAEHFPDNSSGAGDTFAAYIISPGDVLEFIFKQETTTEQSFVLSPLDTVNVNFLSSPAWNSLQRIRPNGAISLPYQSEIVIAGLTVPQATHKIEALYSKILKDPKIFVSLGDFQTKQERLRTSLFQPSTGSTRLVTVQSDGKISLPFAGILQAAGVPFTIFRQTAQNEYRQQYNMDIDVVLNKSSGQQVYLVGLLNQPGAYTMSGPTTALQALSLAHGFRDDAELGRVILVRRQGNTMLCRPLDLTATLEGKGADGLVAIQSGDILYVPKTRLASAAEVAAQISSITFFRGITAGLSWQMRDSGGNTVFF